MSKYQLFYTNAMHPVKTGDVVKFNSRTWTVETIDPTDSYLSCWVWVRSMDDQHVCIKTSGTMFGARFFEVK